MLDHITDSFLDRLKKQIITDPNMNSIPLAYLMQLDIPDSVKHFFDQEVEIWIREEEEKFTTTERFDYDYPEVRLLIDKIFDLLKQGATFHINKFNHLLERAVKLEMNYLFEPHRTLSQFLFKDNSKISTMEIYDTLKYFSRFEYYKTAISDYFNMKYLREISQDQFDTLLNQIDQKVFDENRAEATLKMVKTVLEFLSEASAKEVKSLPPDILSIAFRDRNLKEYYSAVQEIIQSGSEDEVAFEDIEKLLRGESITSASTEETSPAVETTEFEQIETTEPDVSVAEIEVPEPEVKIEEEPEEEEEEEDTEDEYEEDEAIEEEEEEEYDESSHSAAEGLADHVARQISSDSPLDDLNTMIKGRARKKIIKKLFKKKESDFLDFIGSLNALYTWKEASRVIDDEFYERSINPYSKEAISFSDIIYVRFFPKDKYAGAERRVDRF